MRAGLVAFLLLVAFTHGAVAQQQDIFPGLSGEPLIEALRAEFTPAQVFGYDRARDSLFAAVFFEPDPEGSEGTVRCVYTDWPITIDLSSSIAPRTQANEQGVNTEHTWPQSLGAGSGNARSDLHHLYPTRADANSSRSNYPFAELPPEIVTRWWHLDVNQSHTPSGPLGVWSRTSTSLSAFEPRDDHKGPVARAMFYFYTIYPEEASSVDPLFMDIQAEGLYGWHRAHGPDSLEYVRTHLIGSYQGDRPNPFVLDSTLVRRAYFTEPSEGVPFDAIYTFEGTTDCGNEVAQVAVQPDGAAFSEFERHGVDCQSSLGVFNSRGWPEDALDPERYVTFGVEADEGRLLQFESPNRLSFVSRRSATGPSQGEVRLSVDDGPFLTLGSWELDGTGNVTLAMLLPSIEAAASVAFRFYGWGASSSAGTLRFDNVRLTGRTATDPLSAEVPMAEASSSIESVFPNPSRGALNVSVSHARYGPVVLAVHDVLGRTVAVIHEGPLDRGEHRFHWHPEGLASGTYIVRLEAVGGSSARRVVLLR